MRTLIAEGPGTGVQQRQERRKNMLNEKQIRELQAMTPTSHLKLTPVTKTAPITSGPGRDPEGGTAYPTGRFALNAGGSEYWQSLVHLAGYDPGKAAACFEADDENEVVSVRPTMGGGPGIMPVRVGSDGSVVLYLKGVFKQHPTLKPTARKDVKVAIGTDSTGSPCLMIYLQTALTKRKQATKKTEPTSNPDLDEEIETDEEAETP